MTNETQNDTSNTQGNTALVSALSDPQKKLLQHLGLYPILVSTKDFAYNLPYVETASTKVFGIYQKAREATPFKGVLDKGDLLIDNVLERVDKAVPSLKNTNYEDVKRPIVDPVNHTNQGSQHLAENANKTFHTKVYDPATNSFKNVHSQAKTIYEDKAKPKVDKTTNFFFAPINSRLEKYAKKSFPDIKIPNEGACEMTRSIQLFHNFLMRIPKEKSQETKQEHPPN